MIRGLCPPQGVGVGLGSSSSYDDFHDCHDGDHHYDHGGHPDDAVIGDYVRPCQNMREQAGTNPNRPK